jgi:hypothetical protein
MTHLIISEIILKTSGEEKNLIRKEEQDVREGKSSMSCFGFFVIDNNEVYDRGIKEDEVYVGDIIRFKE